MVRRSSSRSVCGLGSSRPCFFVPSWCWLALPPRCLQELWEAKAAAVGAPVQMPVFGQTGCGKRTHPNATLRRRLAPTSGWRSCPALGPHSVALSGTPLLKKVDEPHCALDFVNCACLGEEETERARMPGKGEATSSPCWSACRVGAPVVPEPRKSARFRFRTPQKLPRKRVRVSASERLRPLVSRVSCQKDGGTESKSRREAP